MAFTITNYKNNVAAAPCVVTVVTAANDILIAYCTVDTLNSLTPGYFTWPSGFTELFDPRLTVDGQRFGAAIKIADGTETSLSISNAGPSNTVAGVIRIAGVDVSGGTVASAQAFTAISALRDVSDSGSGSVTSGSATPSLDGALIIAIGALDNSTDPSADTAWTFSTATGSTGAWTTDDTVSNTHFLQIASGHAVQATAGAITITSAWVRSGAAGGNGIGLIGLKPAAGGGAAVSVASPRPQPLLIGLTRNARNARPWAIPNFQPSPPPLIPAVPPTMSPLMARFERRFGRQPFVRPMPAGVAARAYVLGADPGSYTLTGSAATLLAARLVNASAGTYTITGRAASLLKGYVVQATAGSYALTGAAATLRAARLLSLGSGSYVITGRAASLLKGYAVPALGGAYTLNGIDATLMASSAPTAYLLSANPGTYALSGSAATLSVTSSAQANTGGRLPRKIRPGKKRHPDDILREQREEQRYLDELEAKAKAVPAPDAESEPEAAEPTVPTLRDAAARAIPPILSDDAARAASDMQEVLQRAEEAAAAELQKKKRRQALVLLLAHD